MKLGPAQFKFDSARSYRTGITGQTKNANVSGTETVMFPRLLSVSLVLVGVAVASVNLHVQDSDSLFAKAQVPVRPTETEVMRAVDLSFHQFTLIPGSFN